MGASSQHSAISAVQSYKRALQRTELIVAGILLSGMLVSFLLDRHVLSFFKNLQHPFAQGIAQLFIYSPLLIAAAFALALFSYRQHPVKVRQLAIALAITYALAIALKYLVARERAVEISGELVAYAFPSLHAAAATTALYFLRKMYVNQQLWLIAAVAVIALSKLYLMQHYLSDVFGGALVGWGVALVVEKVLALQFSYGREDHR